MRCIVTAGPTYEELDGVRRMTNFSTGALGTELANFLVKQGHDVLLLRGYYSVCGLAPATRKVQVFTTTLDLRQRLKKLNSSKVHAIFHAAAVSDFGFGKIWRRSGKGKLALVKSRKFSTSDGTLLAELAPTPKIIGCLRDWFPEAHLVGWKYELDGGRSRLISLARQQMEKNRTDACVINGAAYGKGYGLITGGKESHHLPTKRALFKALISTFQMS